MAPKERLSGRLVAAVKAASAAIRASLDARDVAAGLGLILLGIGCGMAWLPLGFIAPGAVLTYFTMFGARTLGDSGED